MEIGTVGTGHGGSSSSEPVDMARWLRARLEDALHQEPGTTEDCTPLRAESTSGEIATVSSEELAAIRARIDSFEATLQELPTRVEQLVAARLESLVQTVAPASELRTIGWYVSGVQSDLRDGVLPELKALNRTVASLPSAPDPRVIMGLRVLTEAVQALPKDPEPALLARLDAQGREMRERLSQPDPGVVADLRTIREVVEALVEVVADLPNVLARHREQEHS